MCCCKIIFVICMLVLLLEAAPWRPTSHRVSSQAVTTRRFVKIYTKTKTSGNDNTAVAVSPTENLLPASITPVDDHASHRNKEQILHKAHKKAECADLLVKPLEIEGVVISGINDWFVLDDCFHELYTDEEYYEYFNEYFEEFCEETLYEYEEEEWEEWEDGRK